MLFLKLFFRRNFIRNKLTYLNIAGLTLGMFTFLFIYFYVYTESHFDEYLSDSDEIYHLELDIKKNGVNTLYSTTPIPIAETIFKEVPGIENWCTYCSIFETSVLNNDDDDFLNPLVLYTNEGILSTFHYQTVYGSLENALDAPGKAVITKSAAKKYFGTDQVIGKHFRLLHNKKEPLVLTVMAVIEDIPYNSNIKFEMLCNMDDYLKLVGDWVNSWFIKAAQSYITVKKGADLSQIKQQITSVVNNYMNKTGDENRGFSMAKIESISEKHFKKNYTLQHPTEVFVSKTSLKILFFVGLITLIISWLNYINFLIFQNTKYFKEIGIKKILGSSKGKLILSLIKESLILISIPVLITTVLFFALAPFLYKVFHLQMENIQINSGHFWIPTLVVLLVGTLVSTIVPIVKLTGFQPIDLVRKKFKGSSGKNGSVILTTQFVLSILLIIGILGINSQLNYLEKQTLGFTKENILVLSPPITHDYSVYNQKMELFKEELKQNPAIVAISAASSIPGKKMTTEHFGLKNKEETINKYLGLSSDCDYFNVVDAKFLAGKNFSELPELTKDEIIINETLMHKLGFSKPEEIINKETNSNARIISVIEDYHHTSLHDEVQPMLFKYGLDRLAYLMVRFNGKINQNQITLLKDKWESIFSNSPFEYTLLEDEYNLQYAEEKQLSKVVLLFSVLSIVITILGIIGTCLNNTFLRTKEIGVRKVNGAKVREVIVLLNKDYIKWVIIAFIIASPIGWYVIKLWLESFAYKTTLSWWAFALAGIISIGIALLTVSWQTWRAARRNPVEALRYE